MVRPSFNMLNQLSFLQAPFLVVHVEFYGVDAATWHMRLTDFLYFDLRALFQKKKKKLVRVKLNRKS